MPDVSNDPPERRPAPIFVETQDVAGSFPLDALSLRHLRTFKVAAERLSFTAASDALHLTPSAIAQQVRRLETQLGVRLFERGGPLLVLTQAGRLLQEQVDSFLSRLGGLVEYLRSGRPRNQLEIRAPPFFAREILLPRLHELLSCGATSILSLSTPLDRPDQLPPDADVSVIIARDPPAGIEARPLLPLAFVPACAPAYAREHSVYSDADLSGQVLLVHRRRPDLWDRWSRHRGLAAPEPRAVVRVATLADAVPAAECGVGLVMVPVPLAVARFARGSLLRLSEAEMSFGEHYYIVSRDEPSHREPAARVRELLLKACAQWQKP